MPGKQKTSAKRSSFPWLLMGGGILVVAVAVAIVLVSAQPPATSPGQSAAASGARHSMGSPNAAVTVVEFSDFQ
ncbi:MAG: hypothetical protein AAB502_11720 [Chloroflexota bacterium]